jgi:hypothetical protein
MASLYTTLEALGPAMDKLFDRSDNHLARRPALLDVLKLVRAVNGPTLGAATTATFRGLLLWIRQKGRPRKCGKLPRYPKDFE